MIWDMISGVTSQGYIEILGFFFADDYIDLKFFLAGNDHMSDILADYVEISAEFGDLEKNFERLF